MKQFKPVGDRVLILPYPDEVPASVIIKVEMQGSTWGDVKKGIIESKGDHPDLCHLHARDIVLYPGGIGQPIDVNGVRYLLMRGSEVLAEI